MRQCRIVPAIALAIAAAGGGARGADEPAKVYLAVFDLVSRPPTAGRKMSDTLRVRLRRHEQFEVIDRLTTQEVAEGIGIDAPPEKVIALMNDRLGVNMALYGSLAVRGGRTVARVRCIDLTDPKAPAGWVKEFADDTERARAVLSKAIVEKVRDEAEWQPPEYGDEAEPDHWGAPRNANGTFEDGLAGWDRPDNVATRFVPDPRGAGKVLKITTDLRRAPWMEYTRKLRFGLADPSRPPKIGKDSSYASVAGMEGVHYRSEWLDANAGQRYWLTADMKGKTAGIFFPKIFVKGYLDYSAHAEALPETSLVQRKMSPGAFADLPADRRKALVAADVKAHPDRYRRECFRWYLACRNEQDVWKHYAAPCPPRGGMPANVKWLKIEIYAYWPPGDYLFDNVHLYADPRQKAPLPEQAPRSKFFQGGGLRGRPE